MTLIKSISGIRGTIGGRTGEGFTPIDIVKFTSAFGSWLKSRHHEGNLKMIIGRDARISGEMVRNLVAGSLQGMGIDVIDLGLSTTPTVEMAVTAENAQGGIILTASHNPAQWNALKLLNEKGEFISAKDGAEVLEIATKEAMEYADVFKLGSYSIKEGFIQEHIDRILALDMVNVKAIRDKHFKVVVDGVNSTGGIAVPQLLKALGVEEVIELYCEPTGEFPHNPEPLPENLVDISTAVKENKADVGIVVDPDVDRLALVCENGEMFGEEYTLVAVADYVMRFKKGDAVSNMSSTRALRDVAEKHGNQHYASAVGEVNVVEKMKEVDAVIGGEGNGGVILPELHYGRDALVGIALFLSQLATPNEKDLTASELRNTYEDYFISKNKIELTPQVDVDLVLEKMEQKYADQPFSTLDGLKVEFDKEWVHLRKSNTEPIIRIYAESKSEKTADMLATKIIQDIHDIINH